MICIEEHDALFLQAASLKIAEQYIQAFSMIAKEVSICQSRLMPCYNLC